MLEKHVSQNGGTNIFRQNLYRLVIKLDSEFTLIQDWLNRALNNWALNFNRARGYLDSMYDAAIAITENHLFLSPF